MIYFKYLILAIVICSVSCTNKQISVRSKIDNDSIYSDSISLLFGAWVSTDDKLYEIIIDSKMLYSIYDGITTNAIEYDRSQYSCDSSYMSNKIKGDFILLKNKNRTCYEITGLTNKNLAIRYTARGNLLVFKRK